jgi:copper chaperone CopZ
LVFAAQKSAAFSVKIQNVHSTLTPPTKQPNFKSLFFAVKIYYMKSFLFSILAFAAFSFSFKPDTGNITEKFKVYGTCGMCKDRIEKALIVKGVKYAIWDKDTEMATVKFNPAVVTLDQLHKNVAAVGHDTDLVKADDKVYENLHSCCKYDRPKKS